MSLYDTSEWHTDSEKLQTGTAFEEDSVLLGFGDLDPKLEYSVDIQQLIAETAATTGVNPEQLFPDLLPDSNSLGEFTVSNDHHDPSSIGLTLGDTALLTDAGVTFQPKTDGQDHDYTNVGEADTPMLKVAPEAEGSNYGVGLTAADYSQAPEVQVAAEDGCDVSGSGQGVIVDSAAITNIDTVDLSSAIEAGATLLELPCMVLAGQDSPCQKEEVSTSDPVADTSPRGRGGRRTLKATPPSKKRYVEKNSEEYKERRERNNVAVRKSRDKAKQRQAETNSRVKILSDRNDQLQKKVDLLTKELTVLKGLFTNIGASLPSKLKNFFLKQEQ